MSRTVRSISSLFARAGRRRKAEGSTQTIGADTYTAMSSSASVFDEPVHYTIPLLALPVELIREILSCFRIGDDTPSGPRPHLDTFKSCALVCSTLRPLAQEQLFRNICFCRWWRYDGGQQKLFNIAMYAPHLLPYARRIVIDVTTYYVATDKPKSDWQYLMPIFNAHAPALDEVYILRKGERSYRTSSYPLKQTCDIFALLFERASTLAVWDFYADPHDDIRNLLNLFLSLLHLHIHGFITFARPSIYATPISKIISETNTPLSHLRTFTHDFLESWIIPVIKSSMLRTISVGIAKDNMENMRKLVAFHGPSILHLDVFVDLACLSMLIDVVFPLLPSLITLTLRFNADLGLPSLTRILRSMQNSPKLRSLEIECWNYTNTNSSMMLMDTARAVFEHSPSPALRLRITVGRDTQLDTGKLLSGAQVQRRTPVLAVGGEGVYWEDKMADITARFGAAELRASHVLRVKVGATIKVEGSDRGFGSLEVVLIPQGSPPHVHSSIV